MWQKRRKIVIEIKNFHYMNKKIRLAIIQRICPHYRVSLFKKLSEVFDLTVFFGKGKPSGAYKNADKIEGFQFKILPSFEQYWEIGDKGYYLSFFPTLIKELRKEKFNVIITEGATNLLNNILLFFYKKRLNTPIIWWDAGRQRGAPTGPIRRLTEPIIKKMIRCSDACLGYGEIARDYFLSIGVPVEKIYVAQNTIDIQEGIIDIEKIKESVEAIRQKFRLNGKKVLLYAGSLEKRKKIDFLLKILHSLSRDDIVLMILGDGPDEARLRELSQKQGIESKVYFMGRKIEDRAPYFYLANVYVIPSMYGFVNVALMYKKPVVVNRYITEIELVENGVNGFVCEEGDIEGFTSAILKLIDNTILATKFGKKGWEIITKKANIEKMTEEIESAVKKTLELFRKY